MEHIGDSQTGRTLEQKRRELARLVDELRHDPEVLAAFAFGSFARGVTRPDSDIDLLVIRRGPFRKEIVRRNGVEFELFFNNADDTVRFWKEHRDDFDGFWRDKQLLFGDPETMAVLSAGAAALNA